MSVSPEQFARRSFVYPRLVEVGAEFTAHDDCAIASRIRGGEDAPLALVDLSPLMRTGVKGPGARAWLDESEWPVPEANNTAARHASGALVLRLGDNELLILCDPRDPDRTVQELEAAIPGAGAWSVPRRDSYCWFLLHGEAAVDCLAKLCGVDLRGTAFPPGAVAQTSVARLNAIVCRDPESAVPAFHLLADSASSIWFWDALLDAMAEFGGAPAGLERLAGE